MTGGAGQGRLAIIAGSGGLPAALVAALPERPFIAALDGFPPAGLAADQVFRVERLVPFLDHLQDAGVDRVIFAGAVQRPRLDPSLFDPLTAQMVPRLLAAMQGGDDATLRAVVAIFEDAGFGVVDIPQAAPGLLAQAGALGAQAATPADIADADRGAAILAALAPVDVGQGCVVAKGLCLAVESVYGTDAMLGFVAAQRPRLEPTRGGVFIKRAKAGQDLRVDLPTIGPDTVTAAIAAGLSGICLQAGQVIVLDRDRVIALADAAGLALWAVA
jgi:UDP-2,3-diacylglucosamine hydrolase